MLAAATNITVGHFAVQLSASQTITLLALAGAAGDDGFAFSHGGGPSSLGDVVLRARPAAWTTGARRPPPSFRALRNYPLWSGWHTSSKSGHGTQPMQPSGAAFAVANLTQALAAEDGTPTASGELPFELVRRWERGHNGSLVLRFTLTNLASEALEIGGLGAALPFPWAAGSPAGDAASTFIDPSIGGQHGFATVTRLTGKREVLMLTPTTASGAPHSRSSLEAWAMAGRIGAPNLEAASDVEPRLGGEGLGGEGLGGGGLGGGTAVWLSHSKAYAQAEWIEGGKPWLEPSSVVLAPHGGGAASQLELALALTVAEDVRGKATALRAAGNAQVLGVPGYILGDDMEGAHLLVRPPDGSILTRATTDEPGSLHVGAVETVPSSSSWSRVPLRATADGRPRLLLTYSDGSTQVVAYRTLEAFDKHVGRYGEFAASTFFTAADPFRRSPSCMPWDREAKAHVTDDPRNFVVGLSDEGGAGANVGFAAKVRHRPVAAELKLLDRYIHETLWGQEPDGAGVPVSLQARDGSYGVQASMFWVPLPHSNETGMPTYNYTWYDDTGWVWDRARAESLGRAYNYPHQASVYWSMYRALRDNDRMRAAKPASWYLDQAALTVLGMWNVSRWYSQMGLMVGSVFLELLRDLKSEAHPLANAVRDIMFNRTAVGVTYYSSAACKPGPCSCFNCTHGTGNATTDCPADARHARTVSVYQCVSWVANPFPFGSEFAWDSTGQEEEFLWGRFFGKTSATREHPRGGGGLASADALADLTLTAILAYVPSVPHWAYHGGAWSWGDTSNNAKWSENRRVTGHYRVSLNALPLLSQWLMDPDDWYLLPVAIGAASLHVTTIDSDGASAMGFHLDPAILDLDPYSGDFGIGFYGHMLMAASVYAVHPELGPLCFLCDATTTTHATSDALAIGRRGPRVNSSVLIVPRDSVRRRVFLEPLGVLLEVQAGGLSNVTLDGGTGGGFIIHLHDDGLSSRYRVRIETPSLKRPALRTGVKLVTRGAKLVRGAYEVPVHVTALRFELGHERLSGDAVEAMHVADDGRRAVVADAPSWPDHAHEDMVLTGSPPLAGFEGGVEVTSMSECAAQCAALRSSDPSAASVPLHLRCQAWTFAAAAHSGSGKDHCWLFAGRGNASGRKGFWSATCDNRPAPATDWPCCQKGFGCPDPIGS